MADSKAANIIAVLAVVASLITVVISSCYQQQLARDSAKIQMNLAVWQKKMQSYEIIFQNTADLLTHCDNKKMLDSLSKNYEQKYWNFLPLLTPEARTALKSFKDDIDVMKQEENYMSCIEFKQHAYRMLSFLSDTAMDLETSKYK